MWAIALHAGAGMIPQDVPLEMKQKIEAALRDCLQQGISALEASRSAIDAVEIVVRALENNPLFNAGRGSVFTTNETIEMDACIMDGPTKNCGAVSGLTTVVNTISLARLVMEKSPHLYLGFGGAQEFARQQSVELADPEYFKTETRLQQLRAKRGEKFEPELESEYGASICADKFVGETVGCVAVDKFRTDRGYTHCRCRYLR